MNALGFLADKAAGIPQIGHSKAAQLLDEYAEMRLTEYKQLTTQPPHKPKIEPSALNEVAMTLTVGGAPMDVICTNKVQLDLVDALAGFLKHKGDATYLVHLLTKLKT